MPHITRYPNQFFEPTPVSLVASVLGILQASFGSPAEPSAAAPDAAIQPPSTRSMGTHPAPTQRLRDPSRGGAGR